MSDPKWPVVADGDAPVDEWLAWTEDGLEWFASREAAEAYVVDWYTDALHDNGEGIEPPLGWVARVTGFLEEVIGATRDDDSEDGEWLRARNLDYLISGYRVVPVGQPARGGPVLGGPERATLQVDGDAIDNWLVELILESRRLRAENERLQVELAEARSEIERLRSPRPVLGELSAEKLKRFSTTANHAKIGSILAHNEVEGTLVLDEQAGWLVAYDGDWYFAPEGLIVRVRSCDGYVPPWALAGAGE